MSQTRRYKRAEKNFVQKVFKFFASLGTGIAKAFAKFFKIGSRKLTIMIVPHSQSKVLNFQTSIFSLVFALLILGGIGFSFLWFNKSSISANAEIARLQNENRATRAGLDELRDENTNLLQAAKKFENSLSNTLSLLGVDQNSKKSSTNGQNGDLASMFDFTENSGNIVAESADIKQLANYLESAASPIEEIGKMLQQQGTLFADIPSVHPLKGGIGHVSMAFGHNLHPITGQWYIHKGMDFSTYRSGDPIIATANGQVVQVNFDPGLGNYIIIKHKHGFYTRYGHMRKTLAKKGQFVSQGDIIGLIGNTGVSTGPHLHYEVHIGSEIVDPAQYVNVVFTK